MGFTKRRKQPHLFRRPEIDPTPEVRRRLETQAAVAQDQARANRRARGGKVKRARR